MLHTIHNYPSSINTYITHHSQQLITFLQKFAPISIEPAQASSISSVRVTAVSCSNSMPNLGDDFLGNISVKPCITGPNARKSWWGRRGVSKTEEKAGSSVSSFMYQCFQLRIALLTFSMAVYFPGRFEGLSVPGKLFSVFLR